MLEKVVRIKQIELVELALYSVARGMVMMNQAVEWKFSEEALIDMLVKESNNSDLIASIPNEEFFRMCDRIMKESVVEAKLIDE